ncbi:hypothetical protein MYMA111404_02185 [Mycoplasma marinum]|uniref:Uncharacterized protein n=1 Tax=Mycoplasma marinum TaxID=1937190 RepID=A0A4R0XU77_9MOLU|nr:hypothetical protein [Mycoplasma marinum]TCG11347.1 hypothetical protein C4B24_02230 [Mycoplasma marinum]
MKYRVYIDFEAFNFLGVRNAQPFAFSIATIDPKTKKVKTKTFVNDFDKRWSVEFMKARLVICIKKIVNSTKVNILEEVEFVAFGAELESSILKVWFGHKVKVTDLGKNLHGSLNSLTVSYGENKTYFNEYYGKFLDHLPDIKIKRLNLMGDGAFVGMFGSFMLQDPRYKAKFSGVNFTQLEMAKILQIMKTYSVDDVLRLIYLEDNLEEVRRISEKHKVINREIQSLNNKKRMYATTIKCLTSKPEATIESLQKEISIIETQVIDLKDKK